MNGEGDIRRRGMSLRRGIELRRALAANHERCAGFSGDVDRETVAGKVSGSDALDDEFGGPVSGPVAGETKVKWRGAKGLDDDRAIAEAASMDAEFSGR